MWEVRACRVCLALDGRMYPPGKHRLHSAYETLTGLPLVEECGMPQWLCVECAHSLRKWSAFRSRCRRAGAVLRDIYDAHMQISDENIGKVDRRATMLMSPLVVLKMVPMVVEPSQRFKETEVKGEESTAGRFEPDVLLVKEEDLVVTFSPSPLVPDRHNSEPDHNESEPKHHDLEPDHNDSESDHDSEPNHNNSEPDHNGSEPDHDSEPDQSDSEPDHNDSESDHDSVPDHNESEPDHTDLEPDHTDLEPDHNNSEPNHNNSEPDHNNSEPDHNNSEPDHHEEKLRTNHMDLKRSKLIKPKELKKKTAKSESKRTTKTQADPTSRKKPLERKHYPQSFYEEFATITTPTKEQQLDEIQQRRNTDNYCHSPFKCTLCYRGFVEEATFKNHMMKHDPASGDFECDICRRRFRLRRFLNRHITGSHTHRYSCRSCQHVCASACQARLHDLWHKGKHYECPHCNDSFVKMSSYLSHLRIKHTSQFVCDICGKAFVSRAGVSQHKHLAHKHEQISLEGPYCGECDVRFASEEAYKVHLVSSAKHNHTEKVTLTTLVRRLSKFTCDDCGDSFVRKYRLELHMKCRHTDTQADGESKSAYGSVCDIHITTESECKRRTATSSNHSTSNDNGKECRDEGTMLESKAERTAHCRSHDKRVSVGAELNRITQCKQCYATFPSARERIAHYRRMHPGMERHVRKQFTCEVCGKHWRSNMNLVDHMRVHTGEKPFACSECPKRYSSRYVLLAHERKHRGEKPFACSMCPKRYVLRGPLTTHERTHTGDRPYPCHICDKAFATRQSLTRHFLVHTGVRAYECDRCGKTFTQAESVKLHINTVHLKMPAPYRKRRRRQPVSSLASAGGGGA